MRLTSSSFPVSTAIVAATEPRRFLKFFDLLKESFTLLFLHAWERRRGEGRWASWKRDKPRASRGERRAVHGER